MDGYQFYAHELFGKHPHSIKKLTHCRNFRAGAAEREKRAAVKGGEQNQLCLDQFQPVSGKLLA